MPEEFLDGTQVRPHVEQVGGVAMSKPVGMDPVHQSGPNGPRPQDATHVAGIEAAGRLPLLRPKRGEEGLGQDTWTAPLIQVLAQRIAGGRGKGHDALLSSLSPDPHVASVQVDVPHVERHQLADPDSGTVEQLDQSPIPQHTATGTHPRIRGSMGTSPGGLRQRLREDVTVVDGQGVRQSPGGAGRWDADTGIGLAVAFPNQEAEEGAQRSQLSPQCRGRLTPVAVRQKCAHVIDSDRVGSRRGADRLGELANVRQVGPLRVGREIAFGAQVELEGADCLVKCHSTGTATRFW